MVMRDDADDAARWMGAGRRTAVGGPEDDDDDDDDDE
jgi:hypothetical protein